MYYFQQQNDTVLPGQMIALHPRSVEATVPGNVELDLVRAGELQDPFFGDNVYGLQQWETMEWWYEKIFSVPEIAEGAKAELLFHGVDCLASYWLNDHYLGETDNMMIGHSFNITPHLSEDGNNTLHIRLRSAYLEAFRYRYDPSLYAQPVNWESLWIRKPPHAYGWDIMPRILTAGLWRGVELSIRDTTHEIVDLYIYTFEASEEAAEMRVYYELDCDPREIRETRIEVEGICDDSRFQTEQPVYFAYGSFSLSVAKPKLWWPSGYGKPHLYQVKTRLKREGAVLAEKDCTVGIRTVELERTDTTDQASPGEFLFRVNRKPIWIKGTNWVPADAFHSRDKDRVLPILRLCKDLNCNMIRCWGGNVYEDHDFFDYCDTHGMRQHAARQRVL